MVSNARLDLPEPESPVTTMRLSRGTSSEMFLRLCTRAPCTAIAVRAAALGAALLISFEAREAAGDAFFGFRFTVVLEVIHQFSQVKKCKLLHVDVALLGEADGYRSLADESLIRQVFARRCDAAHV